MKILLIGSGGREHAIAWKLKQSPRCDTLYCAPGNAGIAQIAECFPVPVSDIDGLVALAKEKSVDFVFVAPDNPLADGLVDALEAAGVSAFGPRQAAARIESSKRFAKVLMHKYNIPTARYAAFTQPEEAIAYVQAQGAPIVVKADGLALGKGVVVAETVGEAESAIRSMMQEGTFNEAGNTVVIEEFLTGPEVTVLAFADGQTVVPMPSSQDHKRVGEGNVGPNTGGMGAISPSPYYTEAVAEQCMREIFLPTMEALRKEGCPFSGVLYFGLILTPDGPRVIEYNARFGDPECQTILPLLETDLVEICLAVLGGRLASLPIVWKKKASCTISLCSGGYPGRYQIGFPISGFDRYPENAWLFHCGTRREGESIVTAGGRVLSVMACGDTAEEARLSAYDATGEIEFESLYYRRDIGKNF